MPDPRQTFGNLVRATRVARGYSLRKFAGLVGVSPTYLSQVEQGKVERPPTAERVQKMAELLGQNPDQWIALAGRMSEHIEKDVAEIIRKDPEAMPALLRAAKGMTAEELRKLTEQLKKKAERSGEGDAS